MDSTIVIFLCGIYNVILVIFHILFWKIFNWKDTLKKGTKASGIVIQIMNIQLIYLFGAMALLYFIFAEELIRSGIGIAILFGYAGFWVVRFFQQFIFLQQKGKFVLGLTLLFFIGALLHIIPIFYVY